MKSTLKRFILTAAFAALVFTTRADFFDSLKSALGISNSTATNSAPGAATLSQDQMVSGLKAALSQGVDQAVASLGRDDGFLTNQTVKIPMPEKLQKVETALRAVGQNQMADDFVASMNHAAEKAVPVAAGVFGDAIKQMSIADAKDILTGSDDAATQYFRRTTQTNLFAKFEPIVQNAMDQVGVTSQYKQMMNKFSTLNTFGSLIGKKATVNLDAADLDAYVTHQAMDGLFKMVADEEKNLRANPAARTTELLQKAFGSVTK